MNVVQAARFSHCSGSTIHRLVKEGKLSGAKSGRTLMITTPREQLQAIVAKESPRSGFHKRARGTPATNGHKAGPLWDWLALPAETRTLLLALAARCDLKELQVLVELVAD